MSDATKVHEFNPADEQPIPPWPSPQRPPSKEERLYVLGMQSTSGNIQFYFMERPKDPDSSKDGPLEIRVPTDCVIILKLDSAWNWEFRHENAVMLGPMNYPETPRYFNLVAEIINNRCQKVQFNALYLKGGDYSNRDPYALYINLDQEMPNGSPAPQLVIRIDPMIDNPGDHD
jgi:hypothetical protein